MNEQQLIKRIQSGDSEAFQELYESCKDLVFRCCFRFVGSRHEAEDLTQDVFFQVYKSIRTFRFQSKLSTWIYRIAVNLSLNEIKKRSRIQSVDDLSAVSNHSAPDEERPDLIHEQNEKEEILRKAILSLPKLQRTALILQRYERLSANEIADVMETSVSSVEARLFRAKANLFQKVKGYFAG